MSLLYLEFVIGRIISDLPVGEKFTPSDICSKALTALNRGGCCYNVCPEVLQSAVDKSLSLAVLRGYVAITVDGYVRISMFFRGLYE